MPRSALGPSTITQLPRPDDRDRPAASADMQQAALLRVMSAQTRAVQVPGPGQPLELVERELLEPGPGQARTCE